MKILAILGGGSPYTLQLCEQLANSQLGDEPWQLRLQGRNPTVTAQIARYARARLPCWKVNHATMAQAVLEGADYVIHQVRYGGLEGRHAGESLGRALGVTADETLGPAGLLAAIRCKPPITELTTLLQRYCPKAWVLNITNPLSLTTSFFFLYGHPRCIGICELPIVTQYQIAAHLQLRHEQLQWAYTGLNHRGFLHDLKFNGQTVLPQLLSILGEQDFMGISATLIEEFGAVPTKYFKYLISTKVDHNDRSIQLANLRMQILEQLQKAPLSYPPALRQRQMPWYKHAVVPILSALSGSKPPSVIPVNLCAANGITQEFLATVSADSVNNDLPHPTPPRPVAKWMDVFLKHEGASLIACLDPAPKNIAAAFAADPLMVHCELETVVSTFQTYLIDNPYEHA